MAGFGGLLDSNSREMFVRAAFSSGNAFPTPACPRAVHDVAVNRTPAIRPWSLRTESSCKTRRRGGGGESGSKDRRRKRRRAAPGLY